MTHQELLVKISFDTTHQLREALRAIVELHKSNSFDQCNECTLLCWSCGEWGCEENCDCSCHPKYPCQTIQAIEEQLR